MGPKIKIYYRENVHERTSSGGLTKEGVFSRAHALNHFITSFSDACVCVLYVCIHVHRHVPCPPVVLRSLAVNKW